MPAPQKKPADSTRRRRPPERRPAGQQAARRGVQYTVRNVSRAADVALRRKAAEAGTSLNEVLRQALLKEAGLAGSEKRIHHDLDHLAGTWVDDPEFDAAMAAQDVVDESLWK